MGIASSGNLLANMVGPPAGGFIASQLGSRQVFFVTSGVLLAAVVFLRNFFIDMRGSKSPKEKEIAKLPAVSEGTTE